MVGHIGIDVKGPVRRCDFIKADFRQVFEHQAPVFRIDIHHLLTVLPRLQGAQGGHLRGVWRAEEEVLRDAFDHPHMIFRHHHPADPPARHGEEFREGIDDIDIIRKLERGDGAAFILDAVVNLVGNERDTLVMAGLDQRAHILMTEHCAGGIARAGNNQTVEPVGDFIRHGLQPVFHFRRDAHGGDVEPAQNLAIGRIARLAHPDLCAGIEQGGKGEDECA